MTAPAMAEKLADVSNDAAVERFVDEIAHLIRSQAAGIFGNVARRDPAGAGGAMDRPRRLRRAAGRPAPTANTCSIR